MHKTLKLARREYRAAVRTKGFVIGLMVAPLFMGGSLIGMKLLKGQVDTSDKTIAVIDRSGIVAEAVVDGARERNESEIHDADTGKKVGPAYLIEVVTPDDLNPDTQRLRLSNRVREGSLHAFVEIGQHVLHPRGNGDSSRVSYYGRGAAMDEVRQWIAWPINNHLRRLRVREAGIDEASAEDLFDWIPSEPMGLVSIDESTGEISEARRSSEAEALIVPFSLNMLMFMMIMMGAVPLLNAVVEEKLHRIAEVLLGSVTPFELMAGKVLGGLGVSLTAASVYVTLGVVMMRRAGFGDAVPYQVVPWFFTFMCLAILMIGSVLAALGSTCNDSKEAQSMMPLVMLPVLVPMFVMVPVIQHPNSAFSTWISLVPLFTPMLMTLRLATGSGIPSWQPFAGMAGMVILTLIAIWAGGRVFRVAILMQGQPPKLGNILRWALRD
jgi:ABC-2 type transport system permease protein